jgi:ribulose-5-phosphate 4-epimerase/fuculose-1-phosphate aldolase
VTRERVLVEAGSSLFERSLTHGRTGNISFRDGDELVVTPTGVSLGALDPGELARLSLEGEPRSGRKPSKEWFLHAAMYRARPDAQAVVHLHSTYSVAVSCMADTDPQSALPPLTAYFAMRVGTLPMLPYHAPGDPALGPLAERAAASHHALLLANHGPIVAAGSIAEALDVVEELEETARLHLLLHGIETRPLTAEQVDALRPRG